MSRRDDGAPAVAAVAAAFLRIAVRRWPADMRDELAREWAAELDALARDPDRGRIGRAAGMLGFAASLAGSPPVEDEHGVPRGWREALPGVGRLLWPALVMFLVAGPAAEIGPGLARAGLAWVTGLLVRPGARPAWFDGPVGMAGFAALGSAAMLGAGWFLGVRMRTPRGRVGVVASAALALAAVLAFGWARDVGTGADVEGLATHLPAGVLVWALSTGLVVAGVGRLAGAGRWVAVTAVGLAGALVTVQLGTMAAALPGALRPGVDGVDAWTWPALLLLSSYDVGAPISIVNSLGRYPETLLAFFALALGFSLGAARRSHPDRPVRVEPPATPGPVPAVPGWLRAAGVGSLVTALGAWAHTAAVLTPDLPAVSRSAPMPGGDGELYMWVFELRWAAIAVAALSLLVAAVDRSAAPFAAAGLAGTLVGIDAYLCRSESRSLPTALALAAAAAVAAWWIAGPRPDRAATDRVRTHRRLAVVALAAGFAGPLVLAQGTHAVNHQFLPWALGAVTAALPALSAALSVAAALAVRPGARPLPRRASVPLVVAPAVVLAGFGASTVAGVEPPGSALGCLLAAPLAVLVEAVMRPRARAAVWRSGLAVVGAVLMIPALFLVVVVSIPGSEALFAIAGTSYPADGLSLLPGALLVALPVAALLARRPPPHAEPGGEADPDRGQVGCASRKASVTAANRGELNEL